MADSLARRRDSRLASPPPPVLQGEEAAFVQRWIADPKNRKLSGEREKAEEQPREQEQDDQAPRTPTK